jgi:hypothetical protein
MMDFIIIIIITTTTTTTTTIIIIIIVVHVHYGLLSSHSEPPRLSFVSL